MQSEDPIPWQVKSDRVKDEVGQMNISYLNGLTGYASFTLLQKLSIFIYAQHFYSQAKVKNCMFIIFV